MTGRLIRKGDDKWEMVVDVGRDPLDRGKRQRRSRTFHGSRKAAGKALAAFVTELADVRPTADVKFATVLTAWLEQAELSPTTRREYVRLVEQRIKPALGSISLKKLTAHDLDEFYRALGMGRSAAALVAPIPMPVIVTRGQRTTALSPSSVRQIHAIIRRSLTQAVKWGWVQHNVAANASPPKVRTTKPKPPTIGAVQAWITAATAKSPEFGLAVLLAAATGARRGELCAIRWSDVNLEEGTIRIRRSMYQTGKERGEKDTKTHAERTVDIGESTAGDLKERLFDQMLRALRGGTKLDPHAFVLSASLDGMEPMHPDHLSGAWRRLNTVDGKRTSTVRFHDLRHWSVTESLDQGHSVAAVAERHGHKDANVTLAVYGHSADGRGKKIAAGIDGVLALQRETK